MIFTTTLRLWQSLVKSFCLWAALQYYGIQDELNLFEDSEARGWSRASSDSNDGWWRL